jgi:hypothetical protein
VADFSQEFFDSLQPASFAGIPFGVESFGAMAGHQVAEQTAVGVGTRVLRRALVLQKVPMRAYLAALVGPRREPRDVLRDFDALERAVNNPNPQTLIHPWKGALSNHLCVEFRAQIMTQHVRCVQFDATFAPAEFPRPVPQPTDVASTGADAREQMTAIASSYVDELVPFDELSLAATELGTVGATDAETATLTTAKLLEDANIQASGVPGAIQDLGQATRVVDAGEYTPVARTRLYSELMNIASARNSATLLKQLQVAKLLLSSLGGGALAQSVEVVGGSLQAVGVAQDVDPRILASRNREAVRRWFPSGTVQL